MTTAADKWPAAARLVAVAAAGHSDPLLLHHLKGHDPLHPLTITVWVNNSPHKSDNLYHINTA